MRHRILASWPTKKGASRTAGLVGYRGVEASFQHSQVAPLFVNKVVALVWRHLGYLVLSRRDRNERTIMHEIL